MTTRQPRRTRRRQAPATTLPRPLPSGESEAASSRAPRHTTGHRTHHVTKEIPACFATGEAAGLASALALECGVAPAEVDVGVLQGRLRRVGAYLG